MAIPWLRRRSAIHGRTSPNGWSNGLHRRPSPAARPGASRTPNGLHAAECGVAGVTLGEYLGGPVGRKWDRYDGRVRRRAMTTD